MVVRKGWGCGVIMMMMMVTGDSDDEGVMMMMMMMMMTMSTGVAVGEDDSEQAADLSRRHAGRGHLRLPCVRHAGHLRQGQRPQQ